MRPAERLVFETSRTNPRDTRRSASTLTVGTSRILVKVWRVYGIVGVLLLKLNAGQVHRKGVKVRMSNVRALLLRLCVNRKLVIYIARDL